MDKTAAPTYLCVDGFVVRFGVDDGAGDGVVGNHALEADEVRETLNFCFEPSDRKESQTYTAAQAIR